MRGDSKPPKPDQAGASRDVMARIEEIRNLEQQIVAKKRSLLLDADGIGLDEAVEELSFLLIRAGGRLLALSLTYVEEVVQMPALQTTGERTRAVAGLANFHGEMIAVIDVAEIATGTKSAITPSQAMVISQLHPRRLGLMVDEAVDVVTVPRSALSVSDEVLPGAIRGAGVLQLEDRTSLVIDILWMALGAELSNLLAADAVVPQSEDPR